MPDEFEQQITRLFALRREPLDDAEFSDGLRRRVRRNRFCRQAWRVLAAAAALILVALATPWIVAGTIAGAAQLSRSVAVAAHTTSDAIGSNAGTVAIWIAATIAVCAVSLWAWRRAHA